MLFVGARVPFRVRLEPLPECSGWEWRCADPALRWWTEAEVVDGAGAAVAVERLSLRTGRVTLARCSAGPLYAQGVCSPVSVAAAGGWRFERPTYAADSIVFGGNRPRGSGAAHGELDIAGACALDGERASGLSLLAWLRSAYVALVGPVRVEGRVGDSLSFTFTEEVQHEPA